ncbi:MAG: sigma-70 family RNA polymerase sigma factor [Planctomycetota bacterium]
MNFCKFHADALRKRLGRSPELAAEVEDYLRRAERLRNHLIQANTRLVMSIARKFADARNAFDDLLSHGIGSLVHAVEKFDFDRGYRFSTYATCAVRRDLYRFVMSRKKDLERYTTGSSDHLQAKPDERAPHNPNAEVEWNRLSGAVESMLDELDDRERFIVTRRYGLDESDKKASYSRLGEKLGISKERVRQLANRAMEKLRVSAGEQQLDALLS